MNYGIQKYADFYKYKLFRFQNEPTNKHNKLKYNILNC